MFKLIAIGAGILAIPFFLKLKDTASAGQNLQIFFKKVVWKGFDLSSMSLKLEVVFDLINPTTSDLKINYLYTKVKIGDSSGTTIFTGTETLNKTIPARGKDVLTYPIATPNLLYQFGTGLTAIIADIKAGKLGLWFQYKVQVNDLPDIVIEETLKF